MWNPASPTMEFIRTLILEQNINTPSFSHYRVLVQSSDHTPVTLPLLSHLTISKRHTALHSEKDPGPSPAKILAPKRTLHPLSSLQIVAASWGSKANKARTRTCLMIRNGRRATNSTAKETRSQDWGSIRKRKRVREQMGVGLKGERGSWIGNLVEKSLRGGGQVLVVVKPSLFLSYM